MKTRLFLLIILNMAFGLGGSVSVQAQDYMVPGFYDDTAPYFYFTGAEEEPLPETDVAGYYMETRVLTAEIQAYFTGTGVTVFGLRDVDTPPISVWIYCCGGYEAFTETFTDTTSEVPTIGELFAVSGLDEGSYQLVIQGNGYSLPEITHMWYFDAIEILPAAIEPPFEPTPDPTFYDWSYETEEGEQVVRFQYIATTGDIMVSSGLYALVILGSISLVVFLWKK